MPKAVHRFQFLFALVLVIQFACSVPNFVAGDATAGGMTLAAGFLWALLGLATLQGYEGPRKFIAFSSGFGAIGSLFGVFGALALTMSTMSPQTAALLAVLLFCSSLQFGVYKSVTDDTFKRWIVGKAMQRANAKYAAL